MVLGLQPEAILPDLVAASKDDVLAELATNVVSRHKELSEGEIVRVLKERELLGSTGIGDGVAIPHGRMRGLGREPILAFGRSCAGVEFNALDGRLTHLFFLLLTADDECGQHLTVLARISRLLKSPETRKALLDARDGAAMYGILAEQERIG
jgi:PTS system nitrogen regulatory IIA component